MGEIADWHIDRMLDEGYAPTYRDTYAQYRNTYSQPHEITCQRCGKRNLEWGHDGRKWYLIDSRGFAHKCDRKQILAKTGLDGFESI